jgi:hypothetical protein
MQSKKNKNEADSLKIEESALFIIFLFVKKMK